jgi:hypothetical protein
MGGVDNMDKDKKIGGAFTKKAMFKKWYRMGVLGIFDFMLVNGRVAWNMAASETTVGFRRFVLPNWKFRLILCEQLISFRDESSVNVAQEEALVASIFKTPEHQPAPVPTGYRGMCCVCRLEEGFQSIFRKEERMSELAEILEIQSECKQNNKGLYGVRNLASCSNGLCTIHAHSVRLDSPNLIFKHHQLKGLTCFEIAHHPIAEGLWKSNSNFSYQKDDEKKRRCVVHSVSTDHPLYHYLRTKYGLEKKKRKRVCNNDN